MLRQALRADLPAVVDIWTDAFAGDPFLRWLEPDDGRWPGLAAAWFGFVLGLAFERGHTLLADDDSAAICWIPPDLELAGPDDMARASSILEEHVGAARRDEALATIGAVRSYELDEPHWSLFYIGVRARSRGRGSGTDACRPYLTRCDTEGLACSLVSSNPANVPFYERLGFGVVHQATTPEGTATLRMMVRPSA